MEAGYFKGASCAKEIIRMKRLFIWVVFLSFFSYWIFVASKASSVMAAVASTGTPGLTKTQSPSPTATLSPTSTLKATATPEPFVLPSTTPFIELTNTPLPPGKSIGYMKPVLEAFISIPQGPVAQPYVILSGYKTYTNLTEPVSISGTVGDQSFECASSPCNLNFPKSGVISFHALTGSGAVSEDNQADILVTGSTEGYYLTILTLGKFVVFSDSCGSLWNSPQSEHPQWAAFPQNPAELNTDKSLHYLASRLMASGVVDAKDCPGGGSDGTAPNPCGLKKVKDQMIAWQNQYDFDIWLAGRDQHIPPVMLKSLLELESQFWPITQRLFLDEIGLGQINQLGVDVLLRTNPVLFQQVCSTALYNCNLPYTSMSGLDRSLIRGTLALVLDSSCPSCQYGVDLNKASQSIPLIAQIIYSNCMQSKSILSAHGFTANYDDNWKFTMVSYHSGFGCLQAALDKIPASSGEVTWKDIAPNLTCPGSSEYIDKLWTSLETFKNNKKEPSAPTIVQLQTPTPMPPLPTHTLILSSARLEVKVFVDLNGDGIRQDNEAVDNVQVNLNIAGETRILVTQHGVVTFDLTGLEVGSRGKLSLPGLYRSASIVVPESGTLPIVFIFVKPVLPTRLP